MPILPRDRRRFAAAVRDVTSAFPTAAPAVHEAFAALSPRQREILRRHDLDGETQAAVAGVLGISRRHLIRERNAAIATIALASYEPKRESGRRPGSIALREQLALTLSLEHNGAWRQAAEILESLERAIDDPLVRSQVTLRLGRLYTNADRLTMAREKLQISTAASATMKSPSWLDAERNVAVARLFEASGDLERAERLAAAASKLLRSWNATARQPRVGSALLEASTLRAELALARGDLESARSFASQIDHLIAGEPDLDVVRAVDAEVVSAMTAILCDAGAAVAEDRLWHCYDVALQHGLTRQCASIAANLASVLRLRGERDRSIELLETVLPLARAAGGANALGGVLVELTNAYLERNEPTRAASYVRELAEVAASNPYMSAYSRLLQAKLYLEQRAYNEALRSAEIAESSLVRLGRDRIVGVALQTQGLALAALGRRDAALRTMQLAIDHQTARNHPRRTLQAKQAMENARIASHE